MIRVETGSRLHIGLLRPPPIAGHRGFGGCGLMVDAPAVRVAVEPAAKWSTTGPSADRALAIARRVAPDRPHRIVIEACPPEHVGLGVGTQLGLAVARAVTYLATGESPGGNLPAADLARLTGRGARSAIGLHGFERGGFLVDGGKRDGNELAPLVARVEFPPEWRIVLLTPPSRSNWHGEHERDAFAAMSAAPADDSLCRLVLLGMLPALMDRDLPAFAAALHEYNARAGEPFRAMQGGVYTAEAAELIEWLRRQGVTGVGQSSWGTTVFAVVGDEDRAADLAAAAREKPSVITAVAAARNVGAG
jgi:beta-ribofuranosylaminobenzene 5'-phosphate synthase